MAVLERVDDLDKDPLDEFIIAEERARLDDRVKIAGTDIIDVEDVTALVDLTMEGEHIGMGRNAGMQLSLASLKVLVAVLRDTFNGIIDPSLGIEGAVYNAESPRTQNGHDGECTVVDGLS